MRDKPIEKKRALDSIGISDEKGAVGDFTTYTDRPQQSTIKKQLSGITGDYARDSRIRLKGLKTRFDYLKIQRQYAPNKSMRCCSMYTVQSLVKEDEIGKYTLVKQKGTDEKRKHYLSQESIESIPDMNLKVSQFGSSLSGLQTCDNPYCCMCSRSKSMERSEIINGVLDYTKQLNWGQYFVTLTIQRQPNAKIAVKEIQRRWRKVQKSLQYTFKKKGGMEIEFIRAVDVTLRPELIEYNQCYHIHLHTLILINRQFNTEIVKDLIVSAWMDGGDQSIEVNEQGQDIQNVRDSKKISKYVSKMAGLGLELAYSQSKKGRGGSLSIPQLMEKIDNGSTYLIPLYREFLNDMKNVRTMSFSRGIKILYAEYLELKEENQQNESDSDSPGQEWNILIPPHWWDEFINQQSKIVQSAFEYYNNPKYRDKQKELLIELLEFDPIDKKVWLSEWINGKLNTYDLSYCQ